jgi:hypothetical protein
VNKNIIRSLSVLALFLFFTIASHARAATYYISAGGHGDSLSDSNSCAQAQYINTPKRNFLGSGGVLACPTAPGDTIYVRAGYYSDGIAVMDPSQRNLMVSGTSFDTSGRILVQKYPGDGKVTVNGFGFGDCCQNPPIAQFSYWVFDGLDIKGIKANDPSHGGIYFAAHVDHIRFQNMDVDGDCATLGLCNDVHSPTTGDNCVQGGNTGVEFINVEIHNCGGYGYYGGSQTLFDHVKMHDTQGMDSTSITVPAPPAPGAAWLSATAKFIIFAPLTP